MSPTIGLLPTKLNPSVITIDPKDEIDPEVSTAPRKLSPSITTKLETIELTGTSPLPRLKITRSRTKTTDNKAIHPETPFPTIKLHEQTTEFNTVIITKYKKTTDSVINNKVSSESEVFGDRAEQLHAVASLGMSEIISIVVVLIAAVTIATGIIIVVLRRRKTYKRGSGSSGSVLSDDSDVRFLTSDEVLDFNLARPSEYDEL